jgi:integrase
MTSIDLIERYLDRVTEQGATEATIDTCRTVLGIADKALPFGLDKANEDELRAYLFRRDPKPLSPTTRRNYRTILNSFYEWATTNAVLWSNPIIGIESPKVPETLARTAENEQVQWLLTHAREPYRLWTILAAFGNLRCVEISRLHREHVTADAIMILRGKGDRPRVIPTHPLVWEVIRGLPHGPVATRTARQISRLFWNYCHRRGFTDLSAHRLRGWYATQGYAATGDLLAVSRNMGHKNPRTTAGYIRTSSSQARAVVEGLPTFGLCDAATRA